MEIAMVGDAIVPIEEAMVSGNDRSCYFGDGVYEALRCCNGRLFALDRHMARLKNSLEQMDMLERVDLGQVQQRIDRAMAEADLPDSIVYFHITRGCALRTHDYINDWQPGFYLTVRAFAGQDKLSCNAITHADWRWKRCDIKSLNLLANIMAKHAAVKKNVYEAIFVDDRGLVTEATSSSILRVSNGKLQTAPLTENILPGVTRAYLLEWAADKGLEVCQESFTVDEALASDELMITGTGTEVMGVTHLDDKAIANGEIGQNTSYFKQRLVDEMYQE